MGTQKRERQKELHRAKLEAARVAERHATTARRAIGIGLAIVAVVGFAIAVSVVQGDEDAEVATTVPSSTTLPTTPEPEFITPVFEYGTTPCPGEGAAKQIDFDSGFVDCLDPTKNYTATFTTNLGEVVVELDTERTPGTTNNFVNLARHQYYDGTLIFRADNSIDIVQGGAPHTNTNADPGPGFNITDEGGEFTADGTLGPFTYEPGQLVMARSQGPNSASAQYFFTIGPDSANLDAQGTYVVFGRVTSGLEVLEEMLALEDLENVENPGTPERLIAVETLSISES